MKCLVDTSVWINHFRRGDGALADLLEEDRAVVHVQVIRELAVGYLPNRCRTIADLRRLPCAPDVSLIDMLTFIESHRLWGVGLGAVDVELMASALIQGIDLYTHDKRLARAWKKMSA